MDNGGAWDIDKAAFWWNRSPSLVRAELENSNSARGKESSAKFRRRRKTMAWNRLWTHPEADKTGSMNYRYYRRELSGAHILQ
jgi:hypothetical protein